MKNNVSRTIVAVIFLITLPHLMSGQTIAKTKVLGGGVSFSKENFFSPDGSDVEVSSVAFLPNIGYFVKDNLMVGFTIGYYNTKETSAYSPYSRVEESKGIVLNPHVRYFFHTSEDPFKIYMECGFTFSSGNVNNQIKGPTNSETEWDEVSWSAKLAPGLTYFISDKVAVELGFQGISYTKEDPNKDRDDDEVKTFNIGLNSLLPSSLGFRFYF